MTTVTDEDIEVLGVELEDGQTVREYLVALMAALWEEGESFSGKRPFGNSGWQGELEEAVASALGVSEPVAERMIAHAVGSLAYYG